LLKKYFGRWSPVVSKISDNEDATASLGYSEVLSVQHPVADAIPALPKRCEDCSEIPSAVTAKDARDVLPDDPASAYPASQSGKLKGEISPWIVESSPLSGN
jgi:hypothetical protein